MEIIVKTINTEHKCSKTNFDKSETKVFIETLTYDKNNNYENMLNNPIII